MIYRPAGPLSCPRGSELSFAHSHGTMPPPPPPRAFLSPYPSPAVFTPFLSRSSSLFRSSAIALASHISRLYPLPSYSFPPLSHNPRSSTHHFRTIDDYRSIYPAKPLLYFVYSSKCKRQPASCKRTTFLLACFPRGCSCSRSFQLLRAAMFASLSSSLLYSA